MQHWSSEMDTRERFKQLLKKLLTATRERLLSWDVTADENTFRVTFKGGIVHVIEEEEAFDDEGLDEEGRDEGVYRALLFNEKNVEVESFTPNDLSEMRELRELYRQARESALRPDDVLDRIGEEIDR